MKYIVFITVFTMVVIIWLIYIVLWECWNLKAYTLNRLVGEWDTIRDEMDSAFEPSKTYSRKYERCYSTNLYYYIKKTTEKSDMHPYDFIKIKVYPYVN